MITRPAATHPGTCSPPFAAGGILAPGNDEHERALAVGESAYHAYTPPYFAVRPLDSAAGLFSAY